MHRADPGGRADVGEKVGGQMSRATTTPAGTQRSCQCGSMIHMVPWIQDTSVLIPVDVGHDAEGSLIVVGNRGQFTVRLADPDDQVPASSRRRAHWDVCPHSQRWHSTLAALGLRTMDRSGPCVSCRQRHPYRYGGPVASPLCASCRADKGLPPLIITRT